VPFFVLIENAFDFVFLRADGMSSFVTSAAKKPSRFGVVAAWLKPCPDTNLLAQ